MNFTNHLEDFIRALASREPVPGGGGASALVGAIGTALGHMVGSLTAGKKKYADVQPDILALMAKADALQKELLELVEKDAEAFEPLSKAYGLPKESDAQREERNRVMETALRIACDVPLRIMEKCCEAIDILGEFGAKGAAIAISDVGVGVACCKASLMGASLNVFINTRLMQDRPYAEAVNRKAAAMLDKYTAIADKIYTSVEKRLKQE